MNQPGLVYDINLYVSGPCSFLQVGFYADNGSHYPGSLINDSVPISVPGTAAQIYTLSLPATLLNAGTYWMGVYGNDPDPSVYMNTRSGDCYFDTTGVPFPAVFETSTGVNSSSLLVQMGADYCY